MKHSLLGAVVLAIFLQSSNLSGGDGFFFHKTSPTTPSKAHNQSGIEGHTQTIVHSPPPQSVGDLSSTRQISPIALPIGGESMTISVFSEDSTLVCSTWSDTEGYFKIALKPGTYQVTARPPTGGWPWSPFPNGDWIFPTVQTVIVEQKQYAPLYFEAEVFAYSGQLL